MAGGRLEYDAEHDDAIRASAETRGTPEPHDLAGWWIRVGAYLIDMVVLVVLLLVLVTVAFSISRALGVFVLVVGLVVVWIGYWTYLEGSETGQTLGKRVCGIRVVSETGERAGYGRAFSRTVVARVAGVVPLVGLIDVLWPLWDARRQCLHDKAGSTLVVHT